MAKLDGSDCLLLCCVAWPAAAARLVRIAETLKDPMVRSVALAHGHITSMCTVGDFGTERVASTNEPLAAECSTGPKAESLIGREWITTTNGSLSRVDHWLRAISLVAECITGPKAEPAPWS